MAFNIIVKKLVPLQASFADQPCKDRLRMPLNGYDDTMTGPILSDTVHQDGCDDRPCPKRFCVDEFHKGTTETPGSPAGSSTHAGSSSQASNSSATKSTSDCSATEIADETRVLTVDVSHSQPKEPQVIFREKEAGAPQELKEKKLIKLEKKYRGSG